MAWVLGRHGNYYYAPDDVVPFSAANSPDWMAGAAAPAGSNGVLSQTPARTPPVQYGAGQAGASGLGGAATQSVPQAGSGQAPVQQLIMTPEFMRRTAENLEAMWGPAGIAASQVGISNGPVQSWSRPVGQAVGSGISAVTSNLGSPDALSTSMQKVVISQPSVAAGPGASVGQTPNRLNRPGDSPQSYGSLGFDPKGWGQWIYAAAHPLDARDAVSDAAVNAAKATAKSAYPQIEGRNDEGDAYRHAFWSYNTARKYGPDEAKAFGDLHEIYEPNPDRERLMDLYNNRAGRDLAAQGGNMTADEAIKDAIRRGIIRTTPYE